MNPMIGPEPIAAIGGAILFGTFFIIYIALVIFLLILLVRTCFAIIKIPQQLERLTEVLRERENRERGECHFDQQHLEKDGSGHGTVQ